ncbi:hypothetical protein PTSG_12026 [Salpingoeca rosetta]|uniref:Uncharacterized protein n=1 Tax=Salpingoeca rosetta (strain ATCC 50818 / BSB-021) TaxID=946362 RepID=F2U589_SALR5|nr:uncharacterized protein PTSG_12026 [Salpingoeca rosetta]EGD82805.1 hypothetical protein PTSG_12026 [Salpingoeca rosetta]|eukprot:XP_004996040.1 hypothetical protein PTSG_12026 [Salpingoeca rosetta]
MAAGGLRLALVLLGSIFLILGMFSLMHSSTTAQRDLRAIESITQEQTHTLAAPTRAPTVVTKARPSHAASPRRKTSTSSSAGSYAKLAAEGELPMDLSLTGDAADYRQGERNADAETATATNGADDRGTRAETSAATSEMEPTAEAQDLDDPLEKYNIARNKDYPPPKLKGVEELIDMGYEIPRLSFDYDDSAEARAARAKEKVSELVKEGMPDSVARLRAQLFERELADRKARAEHTRNRAVVRLRQEAKLQKDAEEREARLALMQEKQKLVAEMLERGRQQRDEEERRRDERRRELEERTQKQKEEAERVRLMKEEMRLAELRRQQKANEQRRMEEKEEKEKERKMREQKLEEEREEKRRLVEEFQALRQQQMEENKRRAREERLREMEDSAKMREQHKQRVGLVPR